MIKIESGNLFFKKFHALNNISLEIKKGEKVAFIGHNGAGKSTLLDIIIGVKKLSNGTITYDIPNKKTIKDISGVQFQDHNFPSGIKVKHLLSFYLNIFKMKKTDAYVQKLLMDFQLHKHQNVVIKKLSGGQKQKLNILIAFLNKPKVLMLDEVLTGLDVTSQNNVIKSIMLKVKNNKNLTLIIVSHNAKEIEYLADRIIVLKYGDIIKDAQITDVIKEYKSLDNYLNTLVDDNE